MMEPTEATDVEIVPHGVVLTVPDGTGIRVVPIHWRDLTVEYCDVVVVFSAPGGQYEWPPLPARPDKHVATDDDWRRYDEELVTNSERALAMYRGVLASWYVWARESLGYVVPGGRHD